MAALYEIHICNVKFETPKCTLQVEIHTYCQLVLIRLRNKLTALTTHNTGGLYIV